MLSNKRIRKISEMFDPNIQTTVSLYDHMTDYDEELEFKFDLPMEFQSDIDNFLGCGNELDLLAYDQPSPAATILNHDCMWSGRCTTHPGGCTRNRSTCSNKVQGTQAQTSATTPNTKETPAKPVATSLLNVQPIKVVAAKRSQQNIPAGQSLLRLKNTNKGHSAISVPGMTVTEFLKERDQTRPDTPLSLDEDEADNFKHSIDIAACTMGSNEMSLVQKSEQHTHAGASPTEIIKILKQHLEDSSSDRGVPNVPSYMSTQSDDGLDELINDIQSLSDFENDTVDIDFDCSDSNDQSLSVSNTATKVPTKAQPSLLAHPPAKSSATSTAASVMSIKQSMHSDHSYTRCKSRVNVTSLGVQTPSDSGMFQRCSGFWFYFISMDNCALPMGLSFFALLFCMPWNNIRHVFVAILLIAIVKL